MNHPRRTLLTSILTLALLALGVACQTTEPWHLTAERTIYTAVQTADKFLAFEHEHRAELDPAVTQAADVIRRQMPPAVRDTRAALALYREAIARGDSADQTEDLQRLAEANMQLISQLAATAAAVYARIQETE